MNSIKNFFWGFGSGVETIFSGLLVRLEAEMQFGERLQKELQPDQLEHSDFDTLEGETEHFEG